MYNPVEWRHIEASDQINVPDIERVHRDGKTVFLKLPVLATNMTFQ